MWIKTLAAAAHNRWEGGGGVFSQNPEHPVGIVDARNDRAVFNITSLTVEFGLSKQVFKEMRLTEFFFCPFFD